MASVNAETMKRAYEALAHRDFDAVSNLIDPEIEVRDRPEIPDPQTYRGLDGARASFEGTFETFEEFELVPERFVEIGDRIVAVLLMRGTGRESGVPVESRIAHLWTIRDGKGYRMQVYTDPDEAIAAARAAELDPEGAER